MKWPNWTDPQFVDAGGTGGFNFAESTVSGAIGGVGSGAFTVPGLLSPEAMTVSFSSMSATIGIAAPFGVLASSGVVVRAHGVANNADTQSYVINFASLVPGSGPAITAYLAATITQILQDPFGVPGPPVGHPNYNPNFVPGTAYASNVYSLALAAVTGTPDNVNTFELFRTTLSSGQTTLSAYNTGFQVRAGMRKTYPFISVTGGILTAAQAQYVLFPTSGGITSTLPPASGSSGLDFSFVNSSSGVWNIVTTGADIISGFGVVTINTLALASLGTIDLYSNGINWNVKNNNVSTRIRATAVIQFYVATTGSDTANNGLSSGSPFATIQNCWNVMAKTYDFNGFNPQINVAAGTYVNNGLDASGPLLGATSFNLIGASQTSTVINRVTSNCFSFSEACNVVVQGFFLETGSSSPNGCLINAQGGAIITVGFCTFGSTPNYMCQASTGAQIVFNTGISIAGSNGGNGVLRAHAGGTISATAVTWTLSGTNVFTQGWAVADECGVVETPSCGWNVAFSGPNFNVSTNGVIITNTGNPNAYFPGSSSGNQSLGGQIN